VDTFQLGFQSLRQNLLAVHTSNTHITTYIGKTSALLKYLLMTPTQYADVNNMSHVVYKTKSTKTRL